MTAIMTMPSPKGVRRQLTDIALGSNPNAESRWSQRTGLQADIANVDFYKDGDWSIACNLDRVGRGTVGWIARQGGGSNPPLCGFIVCTGPPELTTEQDEDGNHVVENSVRGRLHGGFWVSGDDVAAAGWAATRAPWGATACRQFRNGETIKPAELKALLAATPDSILRTVALEHRDVTGRMPWWA